MSILVLGATGRVGQLIVKNALLDGYHVKAFVRNEDKLSHSHPDLDVFEGDALNEKDLMNAMHGIKIVFSTLNSGNQETLQKSMPLIIQAMRFGNVQRIISIGTAGILDSRIQQGLYRFQTNESKRKSTRAAEDHLEAYQLLRFSGLNWTIVCPTYMPDGKETGTYRVEKDRLPEKGEFISVGDSAVFAYEIKNQPNSFKTRIGISY